MKELNNLNEIFWRKIYNIEIINLHLQPIDLTVSIHTH